MSDNRFNHKIDLQRENYASIEAVKDSVKTILSYMRNLNKAIEKLELEIEYVKNRVHTIENELARPSFSHPQQESMAPKGLDPPPEMPERSSEPTKNRIKANLTANLPKVDDTQSDLQSELKSALTGGVGLKTIKQAKADDFKDKRTAVHKEFKKVKFKPSVQRPEDETQIISESTLKKQLSKDLDNAFKIINRKFKKKF